MSTSKVIKRMFALLLAGLTVFSTACTSQTEKASEGEPEKLYEFSTVNIRGNTNGNIANLGMGVAQGDRIFFTNPCDDWYTFTLENGEIKKVFNDFDDILLQMNLIDSDLFYISYYYGDMCFYEINGGGAGTLADITSYTLIVDGNWLYSVDAADGYVKRWQMNSQNAEGEKIGQKRAYSATNKTAATMSLTENYVYYASEEEGYGIYRVSLKDKTEEKISDVKTIHLIAENNYVYYISEDDGLLYFCKTDGTELKCVSEKKASAININEKYIYYSCADEGLFRCDLNGQNEIKLSDLKNIAYINLMNEYVFIYAADKAEVMVATTKLLKETGEEIDSWTASTSA